MNRKTTLAATFAAAVAAGAVSAADIQLPEPSKEGGKPLVSALAERKTNREISDRDIPLQTTSALLWAACGINRPDGRRTAPSALNRQEIDVYAIMKDGAYLYDAVSNKLAHVVSGDIRTECGFGAYATKAPLTLVYVVDKSRQRIAEREASIKLGAADIGFIGQNVYLFCASEGLNTVFFAMLDKQATARNLKLKDDQEVFFGQSVGFPPEAAEAPAK